jgi:hypothetical protein
MPYYLDNAFLLDKPWITVVGCGGTGGFVAEGLCRLFQRKGCHHCPGQPRSESLGGQQHVGKAATV